MPDQDTGRRINAGFGTSLEKDEIAEGFGKLVDTFLQDATLNDFEATTHPRYRALTLASLLEKGTGPDLAVLATNTQNPILVEEVESLSAIIATYPIGLEASLLNAMMICNPSEVIRKVKAEIIHRMGISPSQFDTYLEQWGEKFNQHLRNLTLFIGLTNTAKESLTEGQRYNLTLALNEVRPKIQPDYSFELLSALKLPFYQQHMFSRVIQISRSSQDLTSRNSALKRVNKKNWAKFVRGLGRVADYNTLLLENIALTMHTLGYRTNLNRGATEHVVNLSIPERGELSSFVMKGISGNMGTRSIFVPMELPTKLMEAGCSIIYGKPFVMFNPDETLKSINGFPCVYRGGLILGPDGRKASMFNVIESPRTGTSFNFNMAQKRHR